MKYLSIFLIFLLLSWSCIKKQDNKVSFKIYNNWPIVKLKVNNKDAYFIIDTGASGNVINSEDTSKYNFKLSENFGINVGFGGYSIYYKVCDTINILFNERVLKLEFISQDLSHLFEDFKYNWNINLTGILGTNTFNEYSFIIDYNKKTISF